MIDSFRHDCLCKARSSDINYTGWDCSPFADKQAVSYKAYCKICRREIAFFVSNRSIYSIENFSKKDSNYVF